MEPNLFVNLNFGSKNKRKSGEILVIKLSKTINWLKLCNRLLTPTPTMTPMVTISARVDIISIGLPTQGRLHSLCFKCHVTNYFYRVALPNI